jgi:uncharacterized protein YcbX
MGAFVTGLATTAVKGTRLRAVDRIELDENGARGNRRFYVIDERDRLINGKVTGELQTIVADYTEAEQRLALTFADGGVVEGQIEHDGWVRTRFFSQTAEARVVIGPWSEALSACVGRPVRLVQTSSAVDRGRRGAASVISRASLARLAQAADQDEIDARRFRMLIEIDGVEAHAEDRWVGSRVAVGEAVLAIHGHVGRCLITSRDPDTGVVDLPTLDALGSYRRELESTEPLPFGIYGGVIQPGVVRVGDVVSVER